jgi:hypothetical protein
MVDKLLVVAIAVMVVVGVGLAYVFFAAPGSPRPTATQVALATTPPPAPTGSLTPSPTASPSAAASAGQSVPAPTAISSPATGSHQPTETVPPDIAAQIDAVVATVPQVRQLSPTKPVPYFMISRAQFQSDLQADFDKENSATDVATEGRALQRLGLLPAGSDLRQQILDLNGGAVAAFYRPDTGSFYIIERTQPFGPLDRVYVAHEYTHALQDQHFDLEGNRIKDPAEADAALAQLAVIEGDATDTMILWARANLSVNEQIQVAASSLQQAQQTDLSGIAPILARQLNFPYAEGLEFATQLQDQMGWDAVNQAIQVPPASTEQILHPEKYLSHEAPVAVALPDASDNLNNGWSRTFQQTVGEASLEVLVAGGEKPTTTLTGAQVWPHADVAAGWAGDRIYMWEGPDGKWAIGWVLAWDTAADADEFAARIGDIKSQFGGPSAVTTIKPEVTQLLIASDQATLEAVGAAVGQ